MNLLGDEVKTGEAKKMKSFTCPSCGWTIKTPFGENDIIDHAILHSKNHHSGRLNQSNAEAVQKLIKDE